MQVANLSRFGVNFPDFEPVFCRLSCKVTLTLDLGCPTACPCPCLLVAYWLPIPGHIPGATLVNLGWPANQLFLLFLSEKGWEASPKSDKPCGSPGSRGWVVGRLKLPKPFQFWQDQCVNVTSSTDGLGGPGSSPRNQPESVCRPPPFHLCILWHTLFVSIKYHHINVCITILARVDDG